MDQKNTIVKCNRSPKCLFEHNGVCDNYVINIGADGSCQEYIETARVDNFEISEVKEIAIYKPGSKEPLLILKEPQRGQRAKCNFYEDTCDLTFCKPNCSFCTIKKDSYYCVLKKGRIDGFGFMCSKYKEQKE